MRNLILIIISFLIYSTVYSQIITRNNYFTAGNIYPYVIIDDLEKDSVIPSGMNVIWDFSNCTYMSPGDTLHAIDASTTVFFNDTNVNYSITDLSLFEPEGNPDSDYDDYFYHYLITTDSTVHFTGNWANNGIYEIWYYHLPDTERIFQFPFTYGNSFQDVFSGTMWEMSGLGSIQESGSSIVTSDATGTLIMPGATYMNCVRVKATRNVMHSHMWGTNSWIRNVYTWFVPGINGPVLKVETDTNFFNHDIRYYFNNPLVGLSDYPAPQIFHVFPNPGNGHYKFISSIQLLSYDVYSINGNKIIKQDNITNAEVDLTGFPSGVYFIRAVTAKGILSAKILHQQ